MTEHIRWEELAVGHAFSALEPEDEQLFLSHLRGCGLCERTLTETIAVASHLAYAAEPADPPAALREAIVDAVRRSGRPVAFPQQITPLSVSSAAAAPPRSLSSRTARSSYRPAFALVGMAAGLVAVVGLGVWNTNLRANIEVKNAAIARMERVGQITADPATVRVAMTSGAGVRGTALIRGSQAYVLVEGLPVNALDSTYVLWYRDKQGGFHAIETFDVRETDHVNVVEATLDRPIDRIASLAVSREPGRTSPPTPSFALVQGSLSV